jgi:hypothetical protein
MADHAARWDRETDLMDAALNDAGIEHADDAATLAARVRKLARQRDSLHAERTQVREMLDGAGITSDTIPAAVAMLLKERAERRARTPAAPDVAPGGVEWGLHVLYIDGKQAGQIFEHVGGWGVSAPGHDNVIGLPNEATAKAVLLALAGQECGRVEFGLREDAPIGGLLAARSGGLGSFVTDLVAGMTPWTKDPFTVRAWAAHGQAALTISVPE